MNDVTSTTYRGLVRTPSAWLMLLAGPLSLGGLYAMTQLAPAIGSTIDVCGDAGETLCSPSDAFAAALIAVLTVATLTFSLIWIVWRIAMPFVVLGLVLLWLADRRAARRLLFGGALPPAARTVVEGASRRSTNDTP